MHVKCEGIQVMFSSPPPCMLLPPLPPSTHPLWYQILVLPHPSLLPHLHHLTLPVCGRTTDIIEALNHQLDARWRLFGTFLRVDYQTMESIETSTRGKPDDCMLDLLGRWTSNQAGTGTLPRTWQTVVEAVKKTGFAVIAENLAHKHGVTLSQ